MGIRQAKDLLDQVISFHFELAEFYATLERHCDKERVKILLDYLKGHERDLENSLREYESAAPRKVLDRWLQCAPDHELKDEVKGFDINSAMSVDEVVACVIDFNNNLLAFYHAVADQADSDELNQIFTQLADSTDQDIRATVSQANRLKDL